MISWSELKNINESPEFFWHQLNHPSPPTRAMRIGTIVHRIILGGPLVVWEKTRRGKEWDAFKAAHPLDEIVTQAEVDEAKPIAASVLRSPLAMKYLDGGIFETPLRWEVDGVKVRTRGVDILHGRTVIDLKTAQTTKPSSLMWKALSMGYHAQVAWYIDGLIANGYDVDTSNAKLITVATKAPYPVVVLNLNADVLEQGRAMNALWLSQYKACAEVNEWPSYAQTELDLVPGEVELTGLMDEAEE